MVKNADYSSVDSAPSGKRRKIDDEFSNSPLKKQRTRVRYVLDLFLFIIFITPYSFSCGECHRRKQKVTNASFALISFPYRATSATVKYHVLMSVDLILSTDSKSHSLSTLLVCCQKSPRIMQGVHAGKSGPRYQCQSDKVRTNHRGRPSSVLRIRRSARFRIRTQFNSKSAQIPCAL